MCIGAIKQSRMDMVYYGAKDDKTDSYDDSITYYNENKECSKILKDFFKKLRRK